MTEPKLEPEYRQEIPWPGSQDELRTNHSPRVAEDRDQRTLKVESCTFGVHETGYETVSYLVGRASETVF
jgi:hypothetical protein